MAIAPRVAVRRSNLATLDLPYSASRRANGKSAIFLVALASLGNRPLPRRTPPRRSTRRGMSLTGWRGGQAFRLSEIKQSRRKVARRTATNGAINIFHISKNNQISPSISRTNSLPCISASVCQHPFFPGTLLFDSEDPVALFAVIHFPADLSRIAAAFKACYLHLLPPIHIYYIL